MRITLDTAKTIHGSRTMIPTSNTEDGRKAEMVCPVCGTRFTIGCAQKDYCYQYKGRFFCRYNHVMQYMREHKQTSVKRINWQTNGWEHDADWCRRRIAYCRQRIAEFEEQRETTQGKKKAAALTQIHRWKDRLIEAQDYLRSL